MPDVPNDVQRDRILRLLYGRHEKARSPSKIPIGIRDLDRELKERWGMSQQVVASQLDYLVQVGWVREVKRERSFTTPAGMEVSQEQTKYKISDVGINHLESATVFRKPEAASRVNITNIKGVTVIGDGNVVNASYTDLSHAVDALDKAIGDSKEMSDEQKLDAAGDVNAIRSQIAKHSPSTSILAAAWRSLEVIGTLSDVGEAYMKVKGLILPLIGAHL